MTLNGTPTMLGYALDGIERGLAIIPPAEDGTKRPAVRWQEYQQRLPTEAEVRAWYHEDRHGIGIVTGAVSGNLEMLEFEGRAVDANLHGEYEDLAERAGLGDLIRRVFYGYAEMTPSGGIHLLYRVTGPVAGNTKLARRPATADELAVNPDEKIKVLIETRGEGGFVIVAPSHGPVHPAAGEWRLIQGDFDTIATITPQERDELHRLARILDRTPTVAVPPPAPHVSLLADGDRPGDVYNQQPDIANQTLQLLERHGWTAVFSRPHGDHQDIHLRRPGKNIGTSAVLHTDAGTLVVFSTSTPFTAEEPYTPFAVLTVLEHAGDYRQAARTLRPASGPPDLSDLVVNGPPSQRPPPVDVQLADGRHHLPDTFWQARPVLEHIRQAARARMVAPDAVLGAVLTRVAACSPHTLELPPIVGTPVGLTYYAALVGPPEAGKSAAAGVASQLLPAPDRVMDGLPIGSGEGMVEILFEMVDVDDDGGKKPKKEKQQTRYAAIFHVDEGQSLADLGSRSGSTLMPTLRTAWTHGTLGNANASVERRRILPGRFYVYGVTLGIQPELAGPLLGDAAGGTPQRFVWLMATDPHLPDDRIDWPGELDWQPPAALDLELHTIRRLGVRHQLGVHPAIEAEVICDRRAAVRGLDGRTNDDAHRTLARLKTAALLALLDSRLDVNTDDWDLAAQIITTSTAVRTTVKGTLTWIEQRKEDAQAERQARRELRVLDSKEARAHASAVKSVGRIVHRHADKDEHETLGGGCSRRCLNQALKSDVRALVDLDDVAAEAVRNGWITETGGRLHPGESRPA